LRPGESSETRERGDRPFRIQDLPLQSKPGKNHRGDPAGGGYLRTCGARQARRERGPIRCALPL